MGWGGGGVGRTGDEKQGEFYQSALGVRRPDLETKNKKLHKVEHATIHHRQRELLLLLQHKKRVRSFSISISPQGRTKRHNLRFINEQQTPQLHMSEAKERTASSFAPATPRCSAAKYPEFAKNEQQPWAVTAGSPGCLACPPCQEDVLRLDVPVSDTVLVAELHISNLEGDYRNILQQGKQGR